MIITCSAMGSSDIQGSDWDYKLFDVQWAINNSIHAVAKRTTFSLVHSYKREGFVSNPLTAAIRKINDQ
jgi:hypothetical protein